jgi:hypothetical protein
LSNVSVIYFPLSRDVFGRLEIAIKANDIRTARALKSKKAPLGGLKDSIAVDDPELYNLPGREAMTNAKYPT